MRQTRWERTKYCSRKCAGAARALKAGVKSSADANARRADITQPSSYRLIPLTQGKVAKVDIEDYEFLMQFNWAFVDKGYARRTIKVDGQKKNERMHRVIANRMAGRQLPISEQVDHEDGDRLNNRRDNLRIATHNQNSFNVRRNSSFNLAGVAKNHKRFMANITAYKTSFYLGTFDTPEEAAWMRDQWALALHGEFARPNFEYYEVARQGGD